MIIYLRTCSYVQHDITNVVQSLGVQQVVLPCSSRRRCQHVVTLSTSSKLLQDSNDGLDAAWWGVLSRLSKPHLCHTPQPLKGQFLVFLQVRLYGTVNQLQVVLSNREVALETVQHRQRVCTSNNAIYLTNAAFYTMFLHNHGRVNVMVVIAP